MNAWFSLFVSLLAVIVLVVISWFGVKTVGLESLFGVVIPYLAIAVFVLGIVYRVVEWARIPVPFRIPTTCGQGKSLPWIKANNLEAPYNTWGVIGRMALEVLLFRSLFRNTKVELREGPKATYASAKWLWLGGILFHYSFLTIVIRHFRFFLEPVPGIVELISSVDGFFQILVPTIFITDIVFLAAVTYLFLRRVAIPQMRYLSLPADYFPLFLILGIGITGPANENHMEGRSVGGKRTCAGAGDVSPDGARGNRPHLLRAPISGQCAVGLLPIQQVNARAWSFPQPHQKPC